MKGEVILALRETVPEYVLYAGFYSFPNTTQPVIKTLNDESVAYAPDDQRLVANQFRALKFHGISFSRNEEGARDTYADGVLSIENGFAQVERSRGFLMKIRICVLI